jgi:hypothetical protein
VDGGGHELIEVDLLTPHGDGKELDRRVSLDWLWRRLGISPKECFVGANEVEEADFDVFDGRDVAARN